MGKGIATQRARSREAERQDMERVEVLGKSTPAAPHRDRLLHEHTRLLLASALAGTEKLSFTELKQVLDVTDGSLSVHARKLEEAGYIECRKSFAGRVPRTEYRLTAAGRRALEKYLDHMEALIRAARMDHTRARR